MIETSLDVAFARAQFPAFTEPSLHDAAFFENAGGSYVCAPVIERLAEYYRRLKVQPHYPYPASREAGERMDLAHERMAAYLGVTADAVHFGPSSSQNVYVLAQAFRKHLRAGDEIVVTNQDHEANSGAWRRLEADGVMVREWRVDHRTGELSLADLDRLLGARTRLVAFPHCSNIVAHINPVARIAARVREAGALSVVDGVSYAPHGMPNVPALGCDVYFFSLYKTFGPHQGLMILHPDLLDRLDNQGHYFNGEFRRKRLVPAGPDHAQVAAASGIAEYFDVLDRHHGGGPIVSRPERVRSLLQRAERPGVERFIARFASDPRVRVLGPADAQCRSATFSLVPARRSPAEVAAALAAAGVMAASGHFYAVRLLEALGVEPARGVLRLSWLHYTSEQELERMFSALDGAL